jgi:translation initiation factor 3 subunit C
MSRFFASGYSDTESESSSEESVELQPTGSSGVPASRSRFIKDAVLSASESSEDEMVRRVVRSSRDKRYTELRQIIASVQAAQEDGEWTNLSSEFDKFCKQVQKSTNVLEKEGIPKFFVKFLAILESDIKQAVENKDEVKKMTSLNAKSLNVMKQKIVKFNKAYETDLARYHQNPSAYDRDDELLLEGKQESVDVRAPSSVHALPPTKAALRKPPAGKVESERSSESSSAEETSESDRSESELSSDWSAEAESEVSEESEADESAGIERWLKKGTTVADKTEFIKKKERKIRKMRERKSVGMEAEEGKDQIMTAVKDLRLVEITLENVDKRLKEIQESRGKRGFDRQEVIMALRRLLEVSRNNNLKTARILVTLIPIQYEYSVALTPYLNTETWKNVENDLNLLLDILSANPSFAIGEETESSTTRHPMTESTTGTDSSVIFAPIYVESIVNFVERLDDEFTKGLQNIDPHTTEYADRLRDEMSLYRLLLRSRQYFEKLEHKMGVWRITLRIIEHIYYKSDELIRKVHSMIEGDLEPMFKEDPSAFLERLCLNLYTATDDRIRTRAVLCHIYHHALHDRYLVARDLLLLSHLQETIQNADVSSQVLFNRAMVQLGMCAFRLGMIRECQTSLQDIHFSGRVKELLAQGFMLSKYGDKNPEMERVERQRQIPFHMHINIELLECIFLVASMLIEVPNIASNPHDSKTRVISRAYRRMFDHSERQIFTGPPENTRDCVMAASRALLLADWRKCRDLILNIKIWSLVPNFAKVRDMLTREIQEQGLRAFLLTYQNYYDSLGIQQLGDMFELPRSTIGTLVSRMITNDELNASLDSSSDDVILFYHVEPSRLQHLSLQLAEKVIFHLSISL